MDIVHNAALAEAFVGQLDADTFASDLKSVYATTRRLEIISEAVRRAGPEFQDRHPELPWQSIMSSGDIYRHEYDDVAPAFVFKTVRESLQALVVAAEQALAAGD